jgi:SNF2 family DNA or RNA helicase
VPAALQGGTLRPYQLDGLRFLLSLYNNCLNGASAPSCLPCSACTCATGRQSTLSARLVLRHVLRIVLSKSQGAV